MDMDYNSLLLQLPAMRRVLVIQRLQGGSQRKQDSKETWDPWGVFLRFCTLSHLLRSSVSTVVLVTVEMWSSRSDAPGKVSYWGGKRGGGWTLFIQILLTLFLRKSCGVEIVFVKLCSLFVHVHFPASSALLFSSTSSEFKCIYFPCNHFKEQKY